MLLFSIIAFGEILIFLFQMFLNLISQIWLIAETLSTQSPLASTSKLALVFNYQL